MAYSRPRHRIPGSKTPSRAPREGLGPKNGRRIGPDKEIGDHHLHRKANPQDNRRVAEMIARRFDLETARELCAMLGITKGNVNG